MFEPKISFPGYTPVNELLEKLSLLFSPRYLGRRKMSEEEAAKLESPDEMLRCIKDAIDSEDWPEQDELLDPEEMKLFEKTMGSQISLLKVSGDEASPSGSLRGSPSGSRHIRPPQASGTLLGSIREVAAER